MTFSSIDGIVCIIDVYSNSVKRISEMIRTQIYFTERQKQFFKKESERLQTTQSSIIRGVLDEYIDKKTVEREDDE